MAMNEETKDLVWLPASLVKKIKDVESTVELEKQITSYIDECKKDLKYTVQGMDDEVLLFKANMVKAKNAFEEAKKEQLDILYSVWEKYEEERSKISVKCDDLAKQIVPFKREMEHLNSMMQKISLWGISNTLQELSKINTLLQDEKLVKIVQILSENRDKL